MIFRRTLILWFAILFIFGTQSKVYSQLHQRHYFDNKRFNLGFLMGLNNNSYNLKEQVLDICEDGVCVERIKLQSRIGINLGIITNLNIDRDHFAVRFIPAISLEQRNFTYSFNEGEPQLKKIEASYLNLPLLFQFKSKYYRKTRIYVLAGPQLGINLRSEEKVRDNPNLLKIRNEDFSFVIGAGVNLYGDRIKLSPEIRYSAGLINLYEPKFTNHAEAISILYSQVLTLNINFE